MAYTSMRREGSLRGVPGGTGRTKCFRCSGVTEASRAPPSSADRCARAGPPHARQEAPPRGATGGSVRRRARLEKRPWQAGAAPSAMADGCRARGGLEHLLMMSTTTRRRADRSRSGTAAQHRRAPAGAGSAWWWTRRRRYHSGRRSTARRGDLSPATRSARELNGGIVVVPDAPSALDALVSLELLGHLRLPRTDAHAQVPHPDPRRRRQGLHRHWRDPYLLGPRMSSTPTPRASAAFV